MAAATLEWSDGETIISLCDSASASFLEAPPLMQPTSLFSGSPGSKFRTRN